MRRIQVTALDLFDARGYEAVTVEQIAEAAEVSPSSVYRYFGTKEQLVLHDELDLQLFDVLERELASHPPVDAVRLAIAEVMTEFFGRDEELARRKIHYWAEEPAIQPAAARMNEQFTQLIAAVLAEATGRNAGDLDIHVIATTIVWAMSAATKHWYANGFEQPLERELQRALTLIENGLRLD
jgi:AcrR family transcriptional regulator